MILFYPAIGSRWWVKTGPSIEPNGIWSDVACALEDMPLPTMEELTEAYERLTREGETI